MSGHKNGFSLVELSIVLVILGLLTGGILGGQALIKAAELRSVTTEFQQWQTAMNTFKNKYMGIPGDFNKAGRFWGYVNTAGTGGNCSNPSTDEGTGTQTCDGNGDGEYDQNYEGFRVWQHLANAGLISGEFTGVPGVGGSAHAVVGENVPKARLGNGGWGVANTFFDSGSDNLWFAYEYGNAFYIGSNSTAGWNTLGVMTPEDAWNIDTKMDDGLPAEGSVISSQNTGCNDAANRNDKVDISYELATTSIQCALYFVKAF